MSTIVKRHVPCLDTAGCGSSDARSVYDNGTSFCFSCRKFFPAQEGDEMSKPSPSPNVRKKPSITLEEIRALPVRGFRERNVTKTVADYYGVKVSYNEDGEIDTHYYPYGSESYKARKLPKDFTWINNSTDLFGRDKFSGSGKRLIICEGEIDTLSVAQASYDKYKKFYPVVGLSSSVMTKSILENRDWVRSFQEVILCFDEDEAGFKARDEAIKIIGLDKVKYVKLPENDANETLLKHGSQVLLSTIFEAAPYIPAGIISKDALWEALVSYNNTPSIPYPLFLSSVNEKTKGIRLGEIVLFTSGTSSGKSTILREIMIHIKNITDSKIGVVSLEESPAETARKLAGMALNRNPAAEEITLDELKPGFDEVFGTDRFLLLDHQGSLKDETILDKIAYMALSGCKYIIIDHITILVSEGVGALTGNEAIDKVMNDLLRFVKRHNVWIGLVSHLRKTTNTGKAFEEGRMPSLDDIKGSGSIKQISFDIIGFARNLMAPDEVERNTVDLAVLKCRYTGLTGPCEGAYYDYKTGRFKDLSQRPTESFEKI